MEKEGPRANQREEAAEGGRHEDRRFSERGRMMRAIAAVFDDLVAAPRAGGPERLWTSDQSLVPPCTFREKRVANRMLLAAAAFALALSAGHRDAGAQDAPKIGDEDNFGAVTSIEAAPARMCSAACGSEPNDVATKSDIDALNRKLDIIAQCVLHAPLDMPPDVACKPMDYPWTKEPK